MKAENGKHKTVKNIAAWRPSGPVKNILNSELRSGRSLTDVIEGLIAAGAKAKYPKLVSRLQILQEEGVA